MATTLRFLFDYVSPYSYLAWTQIHPLAERHSATVEVVPILFAAVIAANGTRAPAYVPNRRAYIVKDVMRLAHRLGVPLRAPPVHPFNPLLALRVSSLPMPATTRRALADELFTAIWTRGADPTSREVVTAALATVGLPASVLTDGESAPNKELLRRRTEEAIAAGVFGVPSIFAGDELFFGCDSLRHLEDFLDGKDPVTTADVASWGSVYIAP